MDMDWELAWQRAWQAAGRADEWLSKPLPESAANELENLLEPTALGLGVLSAWAQAGKTEEQQTVLLEITKALTLVIVNTCRAMYAVGLEDGRSRKQDYPYQGDGVGGPSPWYDVE